MLGQIFKKNLSKENFTTKTLFKGQSEKIASQKIFFLHLKIDRKIFFKGFPLPPSLPTFIDFKGVLEGMGGPLKKYLTTG